MLPDAATLCDQAAQASSPSADLIDMTTTGPLPDLIATWQQQHLQGGGNGREGQWLVALKGTLSGDRLIVSATGHGLVGVVDFDSESQPAHGRYYAWGVYSKLSRPVSFDDLREGVFHSRRGNSLRWLHGGPKKLDDDEALRLAALAGPLPPRARPTRAPRRSDGKVLWPATGGLSPERVTADLVATVPRLWRKIGFPSRPVKEQWISSADRPDLLAPRVVGEVKNRLRSDWGPKQIERYLATLNRERPHDGPWRGVLIHGEPKLSEATTERLLDSSDAHRIGVWGVYRGSLRVVVKRQF